MVKERELNQSSLQQLVLDILSILCTEKILDGGAFKPATWQLFPLRGNIY